MESERSSRVPTKSSSSRTMSIALIVAITFIVLPDLVSSSIYYQKSPLARFASQSPPGCTYQGVKYQNGDQVVTSEPCLNCTCKRGVLSCFLKVCPTIMFHSNEQNCPTVREPGACCPVIKCMGSDPTTTVSAATSTPITTTMSAITAPALVPSRHSEVAVATSESDSTNGTTTTTTTTSVQTTSPVPVFVASNPPPNYYFNKDEELNNYTQNVNDVFTSYSSLPALQTSSSAPATTTPAAVNGLLSDVNGLSLATTTGLKVASASASQLPTTDISSANKYSVSIKDNTMIFETSPATIVHDSPKFVTSSVTSHPDLRSDPSENELGLESGGCTLNGTMYAEGSAVIPSSFCEYCYCIRGRRMCIRPRCHLSLMDCLPRYTSEYACCPTSYVCACREKGSQFRLGEKMTSNKTCQNCYCSYGGVKKCRQIQCSPSISGCTPITPPGHCCPTEYKCSSNDRDKKPNVRKEEPRLSSDVDESTTDSIPLSDSFTTTLSPLLPAVSLEVSFYALRGQPKVDGPNKESLDPDLIEDGAFSIDDPVAKQDAVEELSMEGKDSSPPKKLVHNESGRVPITSTPGPVSGSAISSGSEDVVERREDDHFSQPGDAATSDSTQLYTFSPSPDEKKEDGKVIGSSSSIPVGKGGELMNMKSELPIAPTTSVPFSTTTNNVTIPPQGTEVTPSPPAPEGVSSTHLDPSIQTSSNSVSHSQAIINPPRSESLANPSSTSSPAASTPSLPSPPPPPSPPHPPSPTTLPEVAEVKIQPNQLYATWKSGSSASAPSNEVNEDRDRVEIILDGIIHALDQRLNEELPSEPRVEDKNKKASVASEDVTSEERKETVVSHKTVTSRKEDDDSESFKLPPIATGYITNLDSLSNKDSTRHKSNPSAFKDAPNIPSSLMNSAVGKIQVSSMIGFASDSPRKPSTHSVQPGSASFLVVDDPSLEYKKGSVFDADSMGGVEIITAKTPFLEAENISDSDSFLINLSPTTLKVGSSSPTLYSGSTSFDPTYESLSPWTSNNRAPVKPMANFPTYYGSSTNQWKIVSQNHGPTGKSPKSEDDSSLYYTEQLSKRSGLAPTSEALSTESEKRGRLDDSADAESSLYAPPGYMKVLSFGSNDGLGHQPQSLSDSFSHQHFRKPNGSFTRVRVPDITGNNANHPYQAQSQINSCFVDGKEYPNGVMIPKKIADPCKVCGCFNGREMCQSQTCPVAPGPNCKSELQPGQCCPRYSCPSALPIDPVAPEASALKVSHADPSSGPNPGHEKEISVKDLLIRAGIPHLPPVPSHVHGFQGRPPPMQLDPTSTSLASNPFPQPGKSPDLIHFPPGMASGEPFGPARPPGMFLGTPTNAFLPPNKQGLPQGPPMYANKNQGNRQWNMNQASQPPRMGPGQSQVIGPQAPPSGYMSASSNVLVHQEPPSNYSPTNPIQLSHKAHPYPYIPTTNKVEMVPSSTSTTSIHETASSPSQLSTASTLAVDTPDKTVLELIMNAATAWETNVTQAPPSTESTGTSSTTTTASPVVTSEKPIWKVSTPKQLIFSGSSTTAPTTHPSTTSTTSAPTTSKSSNPWDLLRVSGCNIYGTFYNVDESINELSTACKKCFCSSFGVQCSKIC